MFSTGDTGCLKCCGFTYRNVIKWLLGSEDVSRCHYFWYALGMKCCRWRWLLWCKYGVSWFSSSAFEYVWTVLINVPIFTNSVSSRSTVQTLSLIVCQPLFFRSVSPVTFMNARSVITIYRRMRGHRLQPRYSWGIVSSGSLRRRFWMGSVGRSEASVRNYRRTLGVDYM